MFALPGLLALVCLDYLRPQEFVPALRGVPLLHAATGLAALGFVVDLRLGLARLRAAPHLVLTILFVVWSIVTTLVRWPAMAVPRAVSLLIPIAIYALVSHGIQSFRMLQVLCGTLLALAVTLSVLGVKQGRADRACYKVVFVDRDRRWIHDGRPCADRVDCEGEGAEPGAEYACERVGFMGRGSIGGRVRWVGTMEDPNELSLVIGIALPFAFAFFDRRRSAWRLLLLALCGAAIGLCTYYTRSRGGQLVFLAVLGVYFVKKVGLARGIAIGLALALPILLFGGRSGGTAEASSTERLEVWWIGLHLFVGSPVLGVGSGLFCLHHYLTAHNSFILTAAELGLPGLIIWTSIMYVATKIPFQALRRGGVPQVARTWSIALLAAMAGLLVGITFLSFAYKIVLWIYVGLTGVLYQAVRRHDPEFEVVFGPRDLALVAAGDLALLAVHIGYTASKLGW